MLIIRNSSISVGKTNNKSSRSKLVLLKKLCLNKRTYYEKFTANQQQQKVKILQNISHI